MTVREYLRTVPEICKQCVENPFHLTQNVSWDYCFIERTIPVFPSSTGPFKLQRMAKRNPLEYKRSYPIYKDQIQPFLKLTQRERNVL